MGGMRVLTSCSLLVLAAAGLWGCANAPAQPSSESGASQMTSLAFRVHNLEAMLAFYREGFGIEFREVDARGIKSWFGELDGLVIKFVPIRREADFEGYPLHQPGFQVADVERIIALAEKYGGRQEGQIHRAQGKIQAAVRDPDGNTIELYQRP